MSVYAGKHVLVLDPTATYTLWDMETIQAGHIHGGKLREDTLATMIANKKVVILQTFDIITNSNLVEQTIDGLLHNGFQFKSHTSTAETPERIMHSIYFVRDGGI
jgi:hypothetical protein